MTKQSLKNVSRKEWLKLRNSSIGGSETATLLGLNPYMSAYELYGIKTGLYEKVDNQNQYTLMGTLLEDVIANLWTYWEDNMEKTIQNYSNETRINNCQKLNSILYHGVYPHISANVDRIIIDKIKGRGVLEIKTISSHETKKWISGLPPQYMIQLQHYLMVTGYTWGQIAVLELDTRKLHVYEFKKDDNLIKVMLDTINEFWDKVIKTKEAVSNNEVYTQYEPPMEPTEAWKVFVEDFWQATPETTIMGDDCDYMTALEVQALKEKIKELEKQKLGAENALKAKMRDNELLTFPDATVGHVTWKPNKNGVRNFYISVKA